MPRQEKTDRSAEILAVFNHYKQYHPRSFPKPNSDQPEWKKIAARLRDGHSVEDLKSAIDGCHRSPFHMGENDRGKRYDSLGLIMRDSSHVQQFLEVPEWEPVLSEKTRRTMRARESYLSKRLGEE